MSDNNFVNSVIHGLFKPSSLKELFEKKLLELEMSPRSVLDILGIQHRTLNGILDGSQKVVDYTNFIKLANFLQIPKEEVIKLYADELEANYPTTTISPDKIKFIKNNFDLAVLKKAGFINSITDFTEIENRIVSRLGLRSIFEYRKPSVDVAFSSGLYKPKNELTRAFWIQAAMTCFEEINNPHEYDRQQLVDYFPQIRWHCINVEKGLLEIIKGLYKIGITVIYQPPLQTLQLRGATFSINDKPCIVLTNYVGFYSTLWFALIHELYHVIFDWDEIKDNKYHLTDDANEQLSVKEREKMADDFAREYLFSKEKTATVRPYLNDDAYVKNFAINNHIHHSMVYVFNAFDTGKHNRMAWAKARKQSPDVNDTTKLIDLPWSEHTPIETILLKRKFEIYN